MAEAEAIAGMSPTGRRLTTPAAELVEVQDSRGLKHLVWVPQEIHRHHPALSADLQLGWMENPEVTGLARLVHHDPELSTFAYATGTCWTVAEIVRIYAEQESGAGVKAGLELCYLVAEALAEANDKGVELGVFSHGNLNPWTVVVKPDGQPLVLAYGLPQVEMRAWHEDPRAMPREDSFRYAPPERLEGHDEDVASDIFALALIGLELMVGRPVYDGLLDDIRQQATRGEGMRRLYQWRETLPANVREVLGRALKPDPDTRYKRALDFVYAVHDLLGSIDVEGPALVEVMARVRAVTKRGKGPIEGGKTGALTAEELRELAADLDEHDPAPLPAPRAPRPEPEPDETAEGEPAPDAPRWKRRVTEEPVAPDPKADARDRLRRRLRASSSSEVAAEAESPRERLRRRTNVTTDDAAPPRARRRRRDANLASQSIELDAPLGFDAAEANTDAGIVPMPLDEPSISDEPDFEDAVTSVAPLATSGGAAALLERLRSSTGATSGRRRRPPRRPTEEVPKPPEKVPERAPVPDVAEADVAPRRRPPPGPAAPEKAPVLEQVLSGEDEEEPPEFEDAFDFGEPFEVETVQLDEPPAVSDNEPTGPIPKELVPISNPTTTVVSPDGRSVVLAVGDDEIVASVVRRAVARLDLLEVDLAGRVAGGWRGAVGGSAIPANTMAQTVERMGLVPVAPESRQLRVRTPVEGLVLDLRIPLVVPSGAVARHLGRTLSLNGRAHLRVHGQAIHSDVLLLEALGDGSEIEVARDE